VLIPRPETELLVEAVAQNAPRGARVIDVGTGSGCIAVSLASERRDLRVFACDISVAALAVARRNGAMRLAASDVLAAFRQPFDVIVSNAPYIPAADVESLATEVREHEPRMALTPGPIGTEVIERVLDARAPLVFLEIGFGQADDIRELVLRYGYDVDEVRNDLAGIPRIVILSGAAREGSQDA
jgi:release factor glutamine methyltransferase